MPDPAACTVPDGVPVGILLAAGSGVRFDPSGNSNKLLQKLPDGEIVVRAAARALQSVVPIVLAVVRPDADEVASLLREAGCRVLVCDQARQGMAATLVHALQHAAAASGWIIALGDMPFVRPATIAALQAALRQGADIAQPVHAGRRGNPVGFSRRHLNALLALSGDEGARSLLRTQPVREVPVDDPGILRDIDVPEDLSSSPVRSPDSGPTFTASPPRSR